MATNSTPAKPVAQLSPVQIQNAELQYIAGASSDASAASSPAPSTAVPHRSHPNYSHWLLASHQPGTIPGLNNVIASKAKHETTKQ